MRLTSTILIALLMFSLSAASTAVLPSTHSAPCHRHQKPVENPIGHDCCQTLDSSALLQASPVDVTLIPAPRSIDHFEYPPVVEFEPGQSQARSADRAAFSPLRV
jgi:hypothetical protein